MPKKPGEELIRLGYRVQVAVSGKQPNREGQHLHHGLDQRKHLFQQLGLDNKVNRIFSSNR